MVRRIDFDAALKRIIDLEKEVEELKEQYVTRKEYDALLERLDALERQKSYASGKVDVEVRLPADIIKNEEPVVEEAPETQEDIDVSVKDEEAGDMPVCDESTDLDIASEENGTYLDFGYAAYKDGIEITKYLGMGKSRVEIPDFIGRKPVVRIGDNVFKNCNEIVEVTFPRNLREIGEEAFSSTSICEFVPGDLLESIGRYAFFACRNLRSVVIPKRVASIESGTFCLCESLRSVFLCSTLKTIGSRAFNACKSLSQIKLPYYLENIESEAFWETNITILSIPKNVRIIGDKSISSKIQHLAFESPDTIIDGLLCLVGATVYCLPGGSVLERMRKENRTVKNLNQFPN